MGRFLLFLAVVGVAIWGYQHWSAANPRRAATSTAAAPEPESAMPSAAKQTIDNARRQAKQIERDSQRRADEMMENTK